MMCFPLQSRPHPMHEAMIGIISFTAIIDNNATMDWESSTALWLCHIWSQRLSQKAPQPHDPDVSKVTMYSGLLLMRVGIIDILFHWVRKGYHYARSEWNDLFSLISLSLRQCLCDVARWPIRDSESLFLHHRLEDHSSMSNLSLCIFSSWRCSSICTVSSVMPRNVIMHAGPSILSVDDLPFSLTHSWLLEGWYTHRRRIEALWTKNFAQESFLATSTLCIRSVFAASSLMVAWWC